MKYSVTFMKGVQRQVKFHIGGEKIPTVSEEPVKSLGRWYSGTLSERSKGIEVQQQAEDGFRVIDATVEKASHWIWLKRDDESWLEG